MSNINSQRSKHLAASARTQTFQPFVSEGKTERPAVDGARDLDPVVERVSNMILSLEPQARFRGRFPNNELRAVRDKILQRSTVGLKKYGVGLARDDLKKVDWLRHAQEEVMDLLNYIEALWYHGCIYWDDEGHGFHTQQLMLIHWAALFEQMIQREGG